MSSVNYEHSKIFKSIAIGVFASIAMIFAFALLFGFVLKMISGIPYDIIDYVMTATEGTGVILGAYIAGAAAKSRGLIIGAACGAIVLLIILACGLCAAENDISILTLIKTAVILICGLVGGIAGVNRREKVHIK